MRCALALALTATLLAACGTPSAFECASTAACDVAEGGRCEPDGRCSYAAGECASGRRFSGLAGPSGGECVRADADAGGEPDGGADATSSPDAAPCTASLLLNGGFESGAESWQAWTQAASGKVVLPDSDSLVSQEVAASSPPNLARLGDADLEAAVHQDVPVPAATTALVVRGKVWVTGTEAAGTKDDLLYVSIHSPIDHVWLEALVTYTNLDRVTGWQAFEVTADATYAGESIRLDVYAWNDPSDATTFYVDDLEVEARICP